MMLFVKWKTKYAQHFSQKNGSLIQYKQYCVDTLSSCIFSGIRIPSFPGSDTRNRVLKKNKTKKKNIIRFTTRTKVIVNLE